MSNATRSELAVIALLMSAVVACGASTASSQSAAPSTTTSDTPHTSASSATPDSACSLLAHACHAHDKDGAAQHACHVLGHHSKDPAECEAKRVECLAVCGFQP